LKEGHGCLAFVAKGWLNGRMAWLRGQGCSIAN